MGGENQGLSAVAALNFVLGFFSALSVPRVSSRIKVECALVLVSTFLASAASACATEQRWSDIQSRLPREIRKSIPSKIGVEAIAQKTLAAGIKLQAAVLVPTWYFGLCDGGPAPEDDDGTRSLVVWRLDGSKWREIGRNSEILYVVKTAGWAEVSLAWETDELVLRQSSAPPPRSNFGDDYGFMYASERGTMIVSKHRSASYFYPMCCGGVGSDEYADAITKHGDSVCEYDGFSGEIDYLLRVATIEQCHFATLPKSKSVQISDEPPSLNSLKDVPFQEQKYFVFP